MNLNYTKEYSEGKIALSKKYNSYSDKYYEISTIYIETITKYEILVKHIFELEVISYLYVQKLNKSLIKPKNINKIKTKLSKITN